MKLENFPEVKCLVQQILDVKSRLAELSGEQVLVRVTGLRTSDTILTIDTSSSSEHECRGEAASFLGQVIFHHQSKLQALIERLEDL